MLQSVYGQNDDNIPYLKTVNVSVKPNIC